jgi:restriction system protein
MSRRSRSPAKRLVGGLAAVWLGTVAFVLVPIVLGRPSAIAPIAVFACALFGVLTLVSWFVARRIEAHQNAATKRLDELQKLGPDAFEEWTAARFRDMGYRVRLTGSQGDHGIDPTARKRGERAVVQVKNYRVQAVGEPVLRDLFGAMHAANADRAYLVTTGRLTEPARTWVDGKPITVWEGAHLAQMANGARPLTTKPDRESAADSEAAGDTDLTVCATCGAAVVVRTNRKSGDQFLGCSTYPRCRATRPI